MNFALLLSDLPHVQESRAHYDALLTLEPARRSALAALWHRLKTLIS
jgi:hypothetical protein